MKTAIDHKKFLELAGRLEGQGVPQEMGVLVSLFKEMGLLMGGYNQSQDLEEKKAVWEEILLCQQSLRDEFAVMCKGWGVSPEEVGAYVENPMNYSAEEWRKVQEVKADVHSAVEEYTGGSRRRKPRRWV